MMLYAGAYGVFWYNAGCSKKSKEVYMTSYYRALGILCFALVFSLSGTAFAKLTEEDFVGYWLLDDGAGDEAADASGNGHDGTITNGKWDAGQIDGGLVFDGAATFMEVEHNEVFNLNQMTVAAWARVDNLPMSHIGIPRKENEYVLHPTIGGGGGYNIRFYVAAADGSWASPVISETVINFEEWHHLAGTYDGKEVKVYIDGVLDKAQPQTGEIPPTENSLKWSNDFGGRMLLGTLDELAIINRALDEDEIQQLMGGIVDALAVEPVGRLAALWGEIRRD
jgi:hypothetical protein